MSIEHLDPISPSAAGQGGLPDHQAGQGCYLTGSDRRVVADTTLGRAQGAGMLHPLAGVDLEGAVVAFQGDLHLNRTGGAIAVPTRFEPAFPA